MTGDLVLDRSAGDRGGVGDGRLPAGRLQGEAPHQSRDERVAGADGVGEADLVRGEPVLGAVGVDPGDAVGADGDDRALGSAFAEAVGGEERRVAVGLQAGLLVGRLEGGAVDHPLGLGQVGRDHVGAEGQGGGQCGPSAVDDDDATTALHDLDDAAVGVVGQPGRQAARAGHDEPGGRRRPAPPGPAVPPARWRRPRDRAR